MRDTTTKEGILMREKMMKAIISYIEMHQYAPSFREIAEMVGLSSTSTVHSHIRRLISEGRLETDADTLYPRALRVPGYKFTKQ